jgi:hypothetical protein
MLVIYEPVRLDAAGTTIAVCDEDWAIDPKTNCMQHQPTGTLYEICVDAKPTEGSLLTAMDFSSRLIAIRPGTALPSEETINNLGRSAIALYLVAVGFSQPEPKKDGGRDITSLPPIHTQTAWLC